MMDITQVVVALIGVLAAVVTAQLIPWIRQKTGAVKWERFLDIVAVAVGAAEQMGLSGVVKDKLAYAETQVRIAMERQGLWYDGETVRAAIEAAVKAMKDEGLDMGALGDGIDITG